MSTKSGETESLDSFSQFLVNRAKVGKINSTAILMKNNSEYSNNNEIDTLLGIT